MRKVTTTVAQLEIGDNIFRDGHIYMVTKIDIHDDDTYATLKLGYPRKIDDGFELMTEFYTHLARPIQKYV